MNTPAFNIKIEDTAKGSARFVIEPLPQGFGDTLGNALRRVLYTSIPGAAITSVHIAGSSHQFSSLPGVREDVVQLVLALKQIRVAYSGEKPIKMNLSVSGPAEVTAADFETTAEVKIANPDQVIAHLADKNSKLEIEVTVEAGLGYSPAEDRKSSTVGVIPVDASFTPVVRVNYAVESTRVGRMTNFDKLVLDIITDGTVEPKASLDHASQILVDFFSHVVHPDTATSAASTSSVAASIRSSVGGNVSIEELDLPTRIANALQKAGFESVADLLAVPKVQLAKVKNLGGKSVKVIEEALSERGFELAR